MSHGRTLNETQHKELLHWLQNQNIELNTRTRREFSDVVSVAQLFKKTYHKLVDMRNYSSRNSTSLKLQNWETFNLKVLRNLGLNQTHTSLENLARGAPGAIELLLYDLMRLNRNMTSKIRSVSCSPKLAESISQKSKALTTTTSDSSPQSDPLPVFNVKEYADGQVQPMPHLMVSFDLYNKVLRECREKEEYLETVLQKCAYFETVISAKDDRIKELLQQLSKLSVSILSKRHSLDDDDNSQINGLDYKSSVDDVVMSLLNRQSRV